MTRNASTVKKPSRSLRTTMLVMTAVAALAGSGAATAAASAPPSDEFPPVRMVHGNQTMKDVARQVLGTGAPGYVARIDDGRMGAVVNQPEVIVFEGRHCQYRQGRLPWRCHGHVYGQEVAWIALPRNPL